MEERKRAVPAGRRGGDPAERDGAGPPAGTEAPEASRELRSPVRRDRGLPSIGPLPPAMGTALAFGFLAFAVVAFCGTWATGRLTLDGAGVEMYLRLAVEHLKTGRVPYWMPEMWAGAPLWAVVPSFSTFTLVPVAWMLGPEGAIKLAIVVYQVIGAWGAFVLARSLWGRRTPAPLLAGLMYGLHPLVVSHGALFGQQPTVAVLAATPWLVWSVVRALRGDGPQYVAIAGLLVASTLLEQAEHVYGLAVVCAFLLAVRLAQVRRDGLGRRGPDGVLVRAAAIALIGVGAVAYWLLPFLSLQKSFVLSPADLVRDFLLQNPLSKEPGAFLRRAAAIHDPVVFNRTDILNGPFYLSWVCVTLALVGIVLLVRRDRDRTITAILCGAAINLWMSTGAIPLASSGPARRGQFVFFVVIGLTSGLLMGAFLRGLELRRQKPIAIVGTLFLVVLPFLTPFVTLQRLIPLLASIRFPRFYPIAVLGLALAAPYPIAVVHEWARRRQPSLALLLSSAVSIAVAGIFLVDLHPYQSYYRVRRADPSAYSQISATVAAASPSYRLATDRHAIPEDVDQLLEEGALLSVGWPHPVASKELWPLTVKALTGPVGYRDRALGLSSTKYVVKQFYNPLDQGAAVLESVRLEENPSTLPLVRAYEQAVVVADGDIAPIMATDLAYKNVVTLTGPPAVARAIGDVPSDVIGGAHSCTNDKRSLDANVAGELAFACELNGWMARDAGQTELGDNGSGAVFEPELDGLEGISVRLDRLPGPSELVVREVGSDGRSLGREVARSVATGIDENQLADFRFPALADSAGHRYAFLVTCPACAPDQAPELLQAGPTTPDAGNLITDGQLDPRLSAQFTLRYERMTPAGQPTTAVAGTRHGSGRWTVQTSGQRAAVIVVAESDFPGWHARVDGKTAPVLKADGAFLGVAVGPGRHTITLDYHKPVTVRAGRMVTTVTLVGAMVLLVAGIRRRRGAASRGGPRPVPAR